jgi:predicted  nucleic acid-binding Zn-ribbon protein
MFTIPVWSLPLLLTLLTVGLGFLWRLATRAERLADKLEAQVERMAALETRLAAINALETAVTQIRSELSHERDLRERLEVRTGRLEERLTATPLPR